MSLSLKFFLMLGEGPWDWDHVGGVAQEEQEEGSGACEPASECKCFCVALALCVCTSWWEQLVQTQHTLPAKYHLPQIINNLPLSQSPTNGSQGGSDLCVPHRQSPQASCHAHLDPATPPHQTHYFPAPLQGEMTHQLMAWHGSVEHVGKEAPSANPSQGSLGSWVCLAATPLVLPGQNCHSGLCPAEPTGTFVQQQKTYLHLGRRCAAPRWPCFPVAAWALPLASFPASPGR